MTSPQDELLLSQIEALKAEITKFKQENSDLKMQLDMLRAKRTRNDRLFDLTLDFMVVKNAANHYWTHVNPALVHRLGYSKQELTSQSSMNFVHPDDRNETVRRAQGVADTGSLQNYENRYLTRDGRVVWLSWTAVFDPKENVVYAVAKDITKIKERELQIAQQKLEIAAASKLNALGRLAAGIAHEVNNPLTIVYGQACRLRQLLSEHSLKKVELLKAAEQIEDMSSRIVQIISGLRAFTRDGSEDALEFVPIKKIIEDTLVFCHGHFKSHGVELRVDEAPDELLVYARPVQISQVLLNLLNNAYDAVLEANEKWIRISVEADQSYLQLEVIDSGAGIPPEFRPQLFEAFFTTKPVGKGTGLGLNIARTILASHGGDIFLDESEPHTTFIVQLPMVT